ncbi:DHA2 family efflux MFS transporter permease subunit [Methanocorpusculum sp.]|nr:DHA2 family efflux MFS transporter permease subunit [Methanocorpusculum sp.]MBO5368784.1 DHA2 family efflux MFS transporter permease subunit [Methanocorpusculum sp.]MBP3443947.1 DHA2 family efflux MFS transporter permease subunit [Methanocorpusculaceae archaeon]MBQ4597761.1 DHA2 family efflux MFS transporter permease subunit [Methanocorpusculum sp.]MBQ9831354.1 DHA2 family efflux MFS transporter permease subunit [Methanocorpusculum sp.]
MDTSAPTSKALKLIILSSALAAFMSSLDGTIVNIALPTISDIFDLPSSSVAWVSTIYLLVMAGSLLVVGKLTDIIGYRKIFLTGFVLFTLGSFACGFLPEMTGMFSLLLLSRVFQALGGVMMTVIAPAMLSRYMPGAARAKGMSVVVLFASLGMALGPTLGGLLTEYLSWNWIFYINVPVGIAALILGIFVLPRDEKAKFTLKGFDGAGAVLIFVGLAALLYAFSEGYKLGWTSAPVLICIVLAVLCIAAFIVCEKKVKSPILDLNLFKNPSFLLLNVVLCVMYFTLAGAQYLLPFYLQLIQSLSTFESGLVLTVMSLGIMTAGVLSGQIYAKMVGKIRVLILSGVAILALGYFFLSKISPVSGLGIIVLGLALIGFGVGLTTTTATTLLMGSVKPEKNGMVSSITGLERFAPMTIGIAFFNLLLIAGVKAIAKHTDITTRPLQDVAAGILTSGFDLCFFVSMSLAVVAFVICLFVKESRLKQA